MKRRTAGTAATVALLAATLCVASVDAGSQIEKAHPQVAAQLKALGAVLDPAMIQSMITLYTPLISKRDREVVALEDLAYGPNDRHRLDVFTPASRPGAPMPVVLFVPGGAYVGGAKSRPGMPFFQNVGNWFARHGMIGVTMNYRLAPMHPWPAGGEDVAAALRWLKKNIAEFGGDPGRIIVFGQSAGATHVAHYIFDEQLQPRGGADGVVGAIVQSGIFDPAGVPPAPIMDAYFGNRSLWAERSLFTKLDGRRIPVFLVFAEYDPAHFRSETNRLREALCKRDSACPRTLDLKGHNHISEILHLDSDDLSLGPDLLDFVRSR